MTNRPALVRIIPFGLFIGLMALDPLIQPLLPSGVDERWMYGVRTALTILALALLWKHYGELRDPPRARRHHWIMAVAVGTGVFILWIHLDFEPFVIGEAGGFDPRTGGTLDLGLTATRLAGAVLLVPVMEELFWRSFLMRWIHHPRFLQVEPAAMGTKALLLSSALFATEHRLWFAGLLAGLAYGWLYKRSGNLWVPILAHAVTNGLLGAYVLATGEWTFW